MEADKIINGNCWVAYFDILGFSYRVESFPVELVEQEYKKALREAEKYNVKCKFKFFSDSFIFYTDSDSNDSFHGIEATSAIFFRAMFLRLKIPMRGCLNIEQFYADEENGIFFGRALIEAHDLAEGQKWIGLVFSEKTREKFEHFKSAGFESNIRFRYQEYEVPYNKDPDRRKLLAYNLNLTDTNFNTKQARNIQDRLWMALNNMKSTAIQMFLKAKGNKSFNIEKCPEYRKIITKYENTEKFMFCVYPELKERTKKQGKSGNMKTH